MADSLESQRRSDNSPFSPTGQHAVVIGHSSILGKPVGMLLERNATVTYCHSKTANLSAVLSDADIVVAAVGHRELTKGSWIKSGADILDRCYDGVAVHRSGR